MIQDNKKKILDISIPGYGICAHRGANDTHPENTLAAFCEAIRLGAHMVEFDVDLTLDGHPVLIHDPTVDRTTNGTGRIMEMTFEDIRKLDAGIKKDPEFAGERIPSLDEALEIMPHNIWINIHIKGTRKAGEVAARCVVKHNRLHQAFLAANDEAAAGAREVAPGILICNMENQGFDTRYVDETLEKESRFIQFYEGLPPAEDIERLKNAGISTNFFYSNDAEELKSLFARGIDFVLADKVEEMLEAAQTIGIQPLEPIYLRQEEE